MNAAQLAEVLDPQHEVAGWWDTSYLCSVCKEVVDGPVVSDLRCYVRVGHSQGGEPAVALAPSCEYIGPPDLATAREHAWRMEVWLRQDGLSIYMRCDGVTLITGYSKTLQKARPNIAGVPLPSIINTNHSAALLEAVERIRK